MSLDQIRNLAHQMRLFGIHEHASRRCEEALAGGLAPLEYLRLVLEDEMQSRRERASKMLLTKARFRHNADLEDWDETFDRGVAKAKRRDLASLSFFHRSENLILCGQTGSGKTHLAIALGRRLCQEGFAVRFHSVNLLFEEIQAQKVAGKYLNFLRELCRARAIVLDDFALRNYSHDEAGHLIEILEETHRKASIIVTSQVEPEGWLRLFEDRVVGEAVIDRLTKPAERLLLKGPSYRDRLVPTKSPKLVTKGKMG